MAILKISIFSKLIMLQDFTQVKQLLFFSSLFDSFIVNSTYLTSDKKNVILS